MKILSKVVDEVFASRPKVVEDAKRLKSARNYLTDLVIRELDHGKDVDLEAVFEAVNAKLEAKQ